MVGIVGALFLVGMGVAMLVSIMNCNTISIVQTIKYGSLWTLFPSAVFMVTNDTWMTMLAVWIPTFFLINQMDESVCSQISGKPPRYPKERERDVRQPTWSFSIWDYLPDSVSLGITAPQIPTL
jgi:hypothetical protein